MPGSPDIRYRVQSIPSLHWAGWSDEYVVFDEASGQTHQLDAVRAYALHLLSDGAQSPSDVLEALAGVPAFPKESVTTTTVAMIFSEFVTCGLVEAAAQ